MRYPSCSRVAPPACSHQRLQSTHHTRSRPRFHYPASQRTTKTGASPCRSQSTILPRLFDNYHRTQDSWTPRYRSSDHRRSQVCSSLNPQQRRYDRASLQAAEVSLSTPDADTSGLPTGTARAGHWHSPETRATPPSTRSPASAQATPDPDPQPCARATPASRRLAQACWMYSQQQDPTVAHSQRARG